MKRGVLMPKGENKLFCLDTHVWIWLMNGDAKLKATKWQKFFMSSKNSATFFISAISIWEIGMLVAKKRIEINFSPLEWAYRGLQAPGMQLAELSPEIALESCDINKSNLADPADRIIVSTAKQLGAVLLTVDQQIIRYSKEINLEIMDISK